MSKQIKFTIIVPVYNSEKYLTQCLKSIINQSLKEIEIICINDGSQDNSGVILERFSRDDARIQVITQENKGQGIARNIAISKARGEFLLFVDSDDFLEAYALEDLYAKFQETKADVIQFDFTKLYDNTGKLKRKSFFRYALLKFRRNLKKTPYYHWRNLKKNCLLYVPTSVWDKAYFTKFIQDNNIQFAPNKQGEDNIFVHKVLLTASNIYYLEKSLYFYRIREGSASTKVSEENFCVFDNIHYLESFLKEKNLDIELSQEFKEYRNVYLSEYYFVISQDSQPNYLSVCEKIMPPEEYQLFYDKIKNRYSFWENIFSIKTFKENGCKIKILRLLGKNYTLSNK